MKIIPAIDLRKGQVVRLTQGDFSRETRYTHKPADIARQWEGEGAQLIHVVDLDGAKEGKPINLDSLMDIISSVRIPIEFGGGLRSEAAVIDILDRGVSRVVLGTKALDQIFIKKLVTRFREKIVVGIDLKDAFAQTQGWLKESKLKSLPAFLEFLETVGVKTVIITDIKRDGTLTGPNRELLQTVLATTKMDVILSGGVGNISHLEILSEIKNKHFVGVIVGKALYEMNVSLHEAIQTFQEGKL
jgi:phosphoribosylformimino-5-aminoimidazole carboxamide ribotide isomerase